MLGDLREHAREFRWIGPVAVEARAIDEEGRRAVHAAPDALGSRLERVLVLEDLVVHLPECPARPRRFGGGGVGMDLAERKVAKDEREPVAERALREPDDRISATAVPALIVAIFNEHDGRMQRAGNKIVLADRGLERQARTSLDDDIGAERGLSFRARSGPRRRPDSRRSATGSSTGSRHRDRSRTARARSSVRAR